MRVGPHKHMQKGWQPVGRAAEGLLLCALLTQNPSVRIGGMGDVNQGIVGPGAAAAAAPQPRRCCCRRLVAGEREGGWISC